MDKSPVLRNISFPLLLALSVLLLAGVILGIQHFFPQLYCPIRAASGFQCPGCGGTTALRALIHGDLSSAFHSNPLFIVGIVCLFAWALYAQLTQALSGKPYRIKSPLAKAILIIIVILAFTIIRNL